MTRVTGIGGVFLYANDPALLATWYKEHFGIEFRHDRDSQVYYLVFCYRDIDQATQLLDTTLAIFPAKEPLGFVRDQAMVNYRVDDLEGLVAQLHVAGIDTSDNVVHRGMRTAMGSSHTCMIRKAIRSSYTSPFVTQGNQEVSVSNE